MVSSSPLPASPSGESRGSTTSTTMAPPYHRTDEPTSMVDEVNEGQAEDDDGNDDAVISLIMATKTNMSNQHEYP